MGEHEALGRSSLLGLLWGRDTAPGGVAADDLVARQQRHTIRPGHTGNAAVPAWGYLLLDYRARTKTVDELAPAILGRVDGLYQDECAGSATNES